MSANRKYFVNKSVVFVTTRTEEGLPIVATLLLNLIIWGILARARKLYKVKVCHFVFLSNHLHGLLVVDDPEHVSPFMGYVKGEISHAINRLLGRRRKTIWVEGYDSPTILTAHDVMRYIEYIYLNVSEANLVESIDKYPGVSSWQMFLSDETTKSCKRVRRSLIEKLLLPALSINEQKKIVEEYSNQIEEEETFILEPFAWVECFAELKNANVSELKEELISNVRAKEQTLSAEREKLGKRVIGATSLRRESMLKEYSPTKFSQKMICICSDVDFRKSFISAYRALCDEAKSVYQLWKRGDLRPKIPAGLLPPRMPSLVVTSFCLS